MKNWHARNSVWPKGGSFDLACCEEVEVNTNAINIKQENEGKGSDRLVKNGRTQTPADGENKTENTK